MYTVLRSVTILPSKWGEAVRWAHEVARASEPYLGPASVHRRVFGEMNVIVWLRTVPDVVAWDSGMARASADPGYQALTARGAEITVPGTVRESWLQTV